MEIQEIKQRLTITEVLKHYGLSPDKNQLVSCPFHEEKTASLQIYPKTNTYHCFGCDKTGDVIEFIQTIEQTDKHSALLKATSLVSAEPLQIAKPSPAEKEMNADYRIAVLSKAWKHFLETAKTNPKPFADYLQSRSLNPAKLEIGYNSGQLHNRQTRQLIASYEQCHLLTPKTTKPDADKQYNVWAKHCLIFALRNKQNQVVSFYGRSVLSDVAKHFYLNHRQGIYPKYPDPKTQTLIICESIIDCATILQCCTDAQLCVSKMPNTAFMAIYGTNGLTEEHHQAISQLSHLQEIIFALDNDEAGQTATEKYAELIRTDAQLCVSTINLPCKDLNETLQAHNEEIFEHLLENRTFIFGKDSQLCVSADAQPQIVNPQSEIVNHQIPKSSNLQIENADYLTYTTDTLEFALLGGINIKQLDRMRVTLRTSRHPQLSPLHSIRQNLDLYNDEQVEKYIRKTAERLEIGTSQINQPLFAMIEQLEQYRLAQRDEQKQNFKTPKIEITEEERKLAIAELCNHDLINRLRTNFYQVGLIGEENNGLLLFLIFLTRSFESPLHAIVHGSSGSGKTHLLKSVVKLVPPESVYTTTALTENVLFYPPYKEFWKHKILLLEDLDGSYGALLPLREFMSNQYISKLTTEHDPRTGEFKQKYLEAEGPIVIAGATTKDKQYEDNANRSFLLYINESNEHKDKVMEHQSKQAAGLINEVQINTRINQIRNMQRLLKPVKIINPYAPDLKLPDYVFKPLRTNTHYLTLIKSITYLYQYQTPVDHDKDGKPILKTTLEHIAIANELSKELLLRKSDELSGALRDFFERLKHYSTKNQKSSIFAKEVRTAFRFHPQKLKRYFDELENRSYIRKAGSYKHKQGFEYEIIIWDDYDQLKEGINLLDKTLEQLKSKIVTIKS